MLESNNKKNLKNVIIVLLTSCITIVISLIVGFVMPKYLSVDDYAYFRIYSLYIAYAGFFHFGFINGIYLKYGKYDYSELPFEKFRSYTNYLIKQQIKIVIILLSILLIFSNNISFPNKMAFIFIILNIPLINIQCYFSLVNQFTRRFIIDSYLTWIQSGMKIITLTSIFIWDKNQYIYLLFFTTVTNIVVLIIFGIQNKDIIFGEKIGILNSEVKKIISNGFFIMISEFMGIIFLGIDSIFINSFFDLRTFGMYSFAVSVISLMYIFINSASKLIYPYLVRAAKDKLSQYYCTMSDVVIIITTLSLSAFFLIEFIINNFLDKYKHSLDIIFVLLITIIFKTLIWMVCGSYYKVLNLSKEYSKNNVLAMILAVVLDILAYIVFKDYIYIAIASVVAFIIWYGITDNFFVRKLQVPKKNYINRYVIIILSVLVFIISKNFIWYEGLVIYGVSNIMIIWVFYKELIVKLILQIKKKK